MSFSNSVTIGPEFFAKAFNDYANKFWAFAREILQNSIDCGSTCVDIQVHVEELSGDTHIVVENDGEPMSSEILTEKLLCLGASGKDFKGSVGGFGKAKEILYFAQKQYTIRTGGLQVDGSGAGYNLKPAAVPCDGTASHVVWEGRHAEDLKAAFRRFIELCGTGSRVHFTMNGEAVGPKQVAGDLNRTLDHDGLPWAEVHISKVEQNRLIVRVGGVPMFHSYCEYKGTVVVELLGTSAQRLTSNRDGLRYPYSNQLQSFISSIAIDPKTVFKLEKAEYKRLPGSKLGWTKPESKPAPVEFKRAVELLLEKSQPATVAVAASVAAEPAPPRQGGILTETVASEEATESPLGHEFIIKNCVKRAVPKGYEPASFSRYAAWLAKSWAACLLELHYLYRIDKPFSVGFIFDEQLDAESESGAYGQVYYINPCKVTKESHTQKFTKADRFDVLASAAHEFVHGAFDLSYHNEDFANRLTEVMGTVMKHHNTFSKLLK